MKNIGYIRVSTDRQELGPEAQRGAILAIAGKIDEWHEEVISGGADIVKREGLLAAVAGLGAGDVLYVAKLDRLARGLLNHLVIEGMISKAGARLVSCAGEGTDGDDPQARLLRQILAAFGEFERAIIRARTKAALAVKRERGEKLGGSAPYGFRQEGRLLVPDGKERAVITLIRSERGKGMSAARIAAMLNAAAIPTRRGKLWSVKAVQRIYGREK